MSKLEWDKNGERVYETGVSKGVLYEADADGDYVMGYAWNGLTSVTESPSGAESNKQYADNREYANLKSREEFGGTIEAFTYPKKFEKYNGNAVVNGVRVGQQNRPSFGFSWRSEIGNDLEGLDYGYNLHLAWGCDAAPSERTHATVSDSPEAATMSWEFTTTAQNVEGINPDTGKPFAPTAKLTIPSTDVDADDLAALELILYGDDAVDPRLPTPTEVLALFAGTLTPVNLNANPPTYDDVTHVITVPAVTGVVWQIDGEDVANGAQPALSVGETAVVTPRFQTGYVLAPGSDDDWVYEY